MSSENICPWCSSIHSCKPASTSMLCDTICFTEDNIPVRTVHLRGLPKSTTAATITSNFNAGEIESVQIYSNKKDRAKSQYSSALVTFTCAVYAARVLWLNYIVIEKTRVKVRRGDSWHQPNIIAETDTTIDGDAALFILNDDCILNIFKYLDAVDLCFLTRTCHRLHNLTKIFFKRYVNFNFNTDIDKTVTLMVARDVLSKIGDYIVSLYFSGSNVISPNHRYLTLIIKHCKNIEQLTIEDFPLNVNAFQNHKNVFPKLKSLEIKSCPGSNDNIITMFTTPAQLKVLKIISSYKFEGHCLKNFINLESITIRECNCVYDKHLNIFFEHCPYLKSLSVTRCDSHNLQMLFEYLSKNLKYLESLNIDVWNQFGIPIHLVNDTNFKNLKVLEVQYSSIIIDQLLCRFAENSLLEELDLSASNFTDDTINAVFKFKNLHILKLNNQRDLTDNVLIKLAKKLTSLKQFECRNSFHITDVAIPKFVELCKTLEILDLTSCLHLTDVSVTNTIDILKKHKRTKLEMKMGGTEIGKINNKMWPFADNYIKVTTDVIEEDFYYDGSDNEYDSED